jgi:cell wall-associated NlpC family hydrolase
VTTVSCPYCTSRFRSRVRHAHRRGGPPAGAWLAILAGAVAAAGVSHVPAVKAPALHAAAQGTSPAGAKAVAYAREQLGQPYLWGGTGPGGFDCSGLAMQAWASAGVTLERTAAEQWDSEHRVSTPRPGDLVFFAGADGTWSAPGHVGIVTDPARHLMVDAYATGWGVVAQTYGLPSSPGGDSPVIGYTDPGETS